MKKSKHFFTLVEIMISSAIALVAVGILTAVMIQLYDVQRDSFADILLSQSSKVIREKLTRQYAINQPNWKSVYHSDDTLTYTVADEDEEWPTAASEAEGRNISLNFDNNELNLDIDDDFAESLNKFEIKVNNFRIETLASKPSDLLSRDRIKLSYLLCLNYAGKYYYREDSMTTALFKYE